MLSENVNANRLDMGRVFSRAFSAIKRSPSLFIGLSLILTGVPSLIGGLWRAEIGHPAGSREPVIIALMGGALLSWVGVAILQAAITRAISSDLAAERPDFAICLKTGLALVVPMLGLTFLEGLGIGLATLLLIVPGIMLAVAWSVAAPAYVQERIGIVESLGRSRALTKGARWEIFVLLLICCIAIGVLQFPLDMLSTATPILTYLNVLLSTMVGVVGAMVFATVQATIYFELRDAKGDAVFTNLRVVVA